MKKNMVGLPLARITVPRVRGREVLGGQEREEMLPMLQELA